MTPETEVCPYCGGTSGVTPTPGTSPKVQAWSCTACRTDWAITTVNPQLHSDRLAATVEQLGVLRQVIVLADEAPMLTDVEMRARLVDLGGAARPGQKPARCCRGK